MANPYEYKVDFDRSTGGTERINTCKSLANYLAFKLGLDKGQVAVTKGTRNVYIYFAKNDKLHTIVWRCWYSSWDEGGAQQIVDFIKNLP